MENIINFSIGFLLGGLLSFSFAYLYAIYKPKPKPSKKLWEIVFPYLTEERKRRYYNHFSTIEIDSLPTFIFGDKDHHFIQALPTTNKDLHPTTIICDKN